MRRLPTIKPHPIRGRRRFFDQDKKADFRDLVDNGATLEEAAEAMDVSIRTVQREMKHDEDFDHEVRLALRSTPDPEKLLKGHARTHWRAAAWLLERTDPDRYARRAPLSACPFQVDKALQMVLEATLAATPPEFRSQMYALVQPACDEAFKWVFPTYGPWGRRVKTEMPKTPLVKAEIINAARDERLQIGECNQQTRERFLAQLAAMEASPSPQAARAPQAPDPAISSAPAALLAWPATPKEPARNDN